MRNLGAQVIRKDAAEGLRNSDFDLRDQDGSQKSHRKMKGERNGRAEKAMPKTTKIGGGRRENMHVHFEEKEKIND